MNWDSIWIVGNGPSSVQFVPEDDNFVVINEGLLRFPKAGAVVSIDINWITKRSELLTRFEGEKYLALPHFDLPNCYGIPGVQYFLWGNGDGFSDDPKILNTGCNSGYAALNLAYLKGVRHINLIGFDMNTNDNDQYRFWAKRFNTTVPQLNQRNISVVNHNIDSAIEAFTKVSYL